ncbi:hypothetical protein AAY473_014356 [Plecturocebus cupreus]
MGGGGRLGSLGLEMQAAEKCEFAEQFTGYRPLHLRTLGRASVTARYGSPEGSAHRHGASPLRLSTRRLPSPRRRRAPPLFRPAGRWRGVRQRCQRGNSGGAREEEVAPGTAGPPPAASAMDASLEKVRTERGQWGRHCGPGPPPLRRLFPTLELPL